MKERKRLDNAESGGEKQDLEEEGERERFVFFPFFSSLLFIFSPPPNSFFFLLTFCSCFLSHPILLSS
jgi:hypothetical protein